MRYNVMKTKLLFVFFFYIIFSNSVIYAGDENQSSILKLYSGINSASTREQVCIYTGTVNCDNKFDYCMKPIEGPDGKIVAALLICYANNIACDDNCSSAYDACKDGDTPLAVCYQQYVDCDNKCEAAGLKCQTDAITAHYEPPDLFRCATYRDICVKRVAEECSK